MVIYKVFDPLSKLTIARLPTAELAAAWIARHPDPDGLVVIKDEAITDTTGGQS